MHSPVSGTAVLIVWGDGGAAAEGAQLDPWTMLSSTALVVLPMVAAAAGTGRERVRLVGKRARRPFLFCVRGDSLSWAGAEGVAGARWAAGHEMKEVVVGVVWPVRADGS